MEMIALLKALNINCQEIILPNETKIISLFDDSFYTQCDFDLIDGRTRSLICLAAAKKGFIQKGARLLVGPSGHSFQFAKPSHTLGCNPADKVKEVLNDKVTTFVTPTQAILLLAEYDSTLIKNESFLKEFLLEQPANIKKIYQWLNHDNLYARIPFNEKLLHSWNDLGSRKAQGKT